MNKTDLIELAERLSAEFNGPAVSSSLKLLRDRYVNARCDSDGVSNCINCNTLFLVVTVEKAAAALRTLAQTKGE